jgi:hypothetical protein
MCHHPEKRRRPSKTQNSNKEAKKEEGRFQIPRGKEDEKPVPRAHPRKRKIDDWFGKERKGKVEDHRIRVGMVCVEGVGKNQKEG